MPAGGGLRMGEADAGAGGALDLPETAPRDDIDAVRADLYALLAALLWQAPNVTVLASLGKAVGGEGSVGAALRALGEAARAADPGAVAREHDRLFGGPTGGELLPYASYYLTGFVHERPLADLRADLHAIGLTRVADLAEPEDHIAFVCEVMAALIRGAAPDGAMGNEMFFARHIRPWADRFFADLASSSHEPFHRAVGCLGGALVGVEADALALPA